MYDLCQSLGQKLCVKQVGAFVGITKGIFGFLMYEFIKVVCRPYEASKVFQMVSNMMHKLVRFCICVQIERQHDSFPKVEAESL